MPCFYRPPRTKTRGPLNQHISQVIKAKIGGELQEGHQPRACYGMLRSRRRHPAIHGYLSSQISSRRLALKRLSTMIGQPLDVGVPAARKARIKDDRSGGVFG